MRTLRLQHENNVVRTSTSSAGTCVKSNSLLIRATRMNQRQHPLCLLRAWKRESSPPRSKNDPKPLKQMGEIRCLYRRVDADPLVVG